ncbi:MAG: hypothetical protein MJ231_07115, partial [bacterium]|nr:hypothetical protein [bacterium]
MGGNVLGINNYFMTPDSMQYQLMLMQMSQQMALQAQALQRIQGQQIQQSVAPANQNITQPSFKGGATVSAEQQIQTQNKKKISKAGKWAIGLGTTAVGLVTAATLISKGQCAKIAKLYKEKLIPKTFTEKLEFKKAETIEDAIKYAKETLGIKEVDSL